MALEDEEGLECPAISLIQVQQIELVSKMARNSSRHFLRPRLFNKGFFYSLNVELTGRRRAKPRGNPTAQLLGGPC